MSDTVKSDGSIDFAALVVSEAVLKFSEAMSQHVAIIGMSLRDFANAVDKQKKELLKCKEALLQIRKYARTLNELDREIIQSTIDSVGFDDPKYPNDVIIGYLVWLLLQIVESMEYSDRVAGLLMRNGVNQSLHVVGLSLLNAAPIDKD